MPSKSHERLRPRLCKLERGDTGYGFHLHGEKGKTGQFIRLVEADSPAESAGLRPGDRIVFVNGEDVETQSHQQVVSRIRATVGPLALIVIDPETEQLLKRHGLKCQKEYVTEGVPVEEVEDEEDEEEETGERQVDDDDEGEETVDARNVEGTENGEDERSVNDEDEVVTTEVEVGEETREETQEEVSEETCVETNEETCEEVTEETKDDAHLDVIPRQSTPVPEEQTHESNGDIHNHVEIEKKLSINSEKEESTELRPRLCVIQRGPNGYGFNLHSERARPGQFIRAVDEDSPAESAGLHPQDRIVQVNGLIVEGKTHSQVVSAIKAGGAETRLLVVDPETDAFFKRCRVTPTEEHLTETKEPELHSKSSVSPSPSNASSNTSLTTPPTNTPPEGLINNAIPALNLTLQQVKELAHQKRSNKRAPPMDWTKKNELFSNL
uniref:Na(+)/H(+) exchange regulatory cofactor NHE-RF1 n=1 Tax=Neogobius melanostomus TaxID=47308 RepID=A0A8C6TN85_9GOBI